MEVGRPNPRGQYKYLFFVLRKPLKRSTFLIPIFVQNLSGGGYVTQFQLPGTKRNWNSSYILEYFGRQF